MVYLLCFHAPFKHARHYLGYTENGRTLRERLKHHEAGTGARLLQAVTEAGITWEVVRVWKDGTRDFERQLKNRKEAPRLCPKCSKNPKPAKQTKTA